MAPMLTDEQRKAIDEQHGAPVFIDDPVAARRYVILSEDVFHRVEALLATDTFDARESYLAQEQALGRAGWDDPSMDAYNDYDTHRPKP